MIAEPTWVQIALIASDFEKTRRFYAEVLGLSVEESWDNPAPNGKGVIFRCGSAYIEILDQAAAEHVADVSDGRSLHLGARPAGLVLGVPDVDRVYDELRGKDAAPLSSLWDAPWGHRGFRIADLDGFVLTFFTDRRPGRSS